MKMESSAQRKIKFSTGCQVGFISINEGRPILLLTEHWQWLERNSYRTDGNSMCLTECLLDELYKGGYIRKPNLEVVVDECIRRMLETKDKRRNALTQHLYDLYKERAPKEVFERAKTECKREIREIDEAEKKLNDFIDKIPQKRN